MNVKFNGELAELAHNEIRSLVEKATFIGIRNNVGPGVTVSMLVGLIGHQFGDLVRCAFDDQKALMHQTLLDSFRLGMAPTIGDALQVFKDVTAQLPAGGKPPSVN